MEPLKTSFIFRFRGVAATEFKDDPKKILNKMCRVLKTFKENSDRIKLLFVLHPETSDFLYNLYPDMYDMYEAIIYDYIEENYGLFDDGTHITEAIEFSDAYFGNGNQYIGKFIENNKPVMIQNADI